MTNTWVPKIGDYFPNFWADSTQGDISFHKWAEGNWTVLFSHPCAFTPVCSSEMAEFAALKDEFRSRDVKVLGLTNSSHEDESRWLEDIERTFDVDIDFPVISDPDHMLSKSCGIYATESMPDYRIRKTFIIDPSLRIQMIFEYPVMVGRSTEELLRVIDALKMSAKHQVAMPCDWTAGKHCLVSSKFDDMQATALYGDNWFKVRDYLRVVDGLEDSIR
ncbi:redoxin domain-containing protein [Oceaniglobus indicus]|uniref:redoxin domain-containing protein n=1 Tax=Oceaniglobus indicus TaxID=2047749 RepID=UPI0013045E07|nr:redoxin domain-containing protein [Oceaniglobus indicus]